MKVLVTGAGGFLGREVVRLAAGAGHDVMAMVRPRGATSDASAAMGVETIVGDLRQRGPWLDRMAEVEAVIHLAAATSGDLGAQVAGTLVATENLLAGLEGAPLRRFVHISSFSVYDYSRLRSGSTLDEHAPLEAEPQRRDAYTMTKLAQERLVRAWCEDRATDLVVIRPGAIFGPGADWDHGAGLTLGRLAFIVSPRAPFRLTFVTNCADAVVRAVQSPDAAGRTLNVVDDDLPSHREFFDLCRSEGLTSRWPVPVPWSVIDGLGRIVEGAARRRRSGDVKLPEILSHRRQQARWKPLSYTNDTAEDVLDWRPEISIREGVARLAQPGEGPAREVSPTAP